MTLAFALAAIAIGASFEGGSLGRVERLAPDHLRCAVKGQADQNNRNRQANWYYFRLDNLPSQEIRIDLVDLVGEYNFRPGTHAVTANTRPVFSYDDRTWTHFQDGDVTWDDKEIRLTIRFKPERPTMWIAHTTPYTKRDLDRLLAVKSPYLRHETVGKSVHGRDIVLLTVTDPAVPQSAKRVVWLMARQHAWETGTSWAAEGAVRFLLSDEPEAARIRRDTVFKVMPVFDPDGVAAGAVRFNANGFDNNRNWDAVDARLMPEIASVRKAILAWLDAGNRIDVFLAMHNTESTDYVVGPPAYMGLAKDLVQRLREETSFYDPRSPRDGMGKEPIAKGRMSVNQALFSERKVPAFLMEMMVERHPSLQRPRTVKDILDFGRGLAVCLASARP
ncbi:MAG TPA: M14-type cytosolic carboxypeptidase [Bryobacteraceae bacterium]|nr:M14-type cytosolic carboxypeptidase [Bryobacteraceae bacterium]